ncbi:uncharacterized protein LOC106129920 [Amyelois transitella]|uniref:uncharacterized protein LOC106129920 n=1 Tax=Amyelois transitella TaxID=680683 RepID=UPI00067D21FA|nr:uncharacterized protein LOC106129920 [Amyelois transitella]
MTKCSVKKCKNCPRIALKKDGVSYFIFPQNAIMRNEWISIIARDRGEEFFKPQKGAVVCSEHFLPSDIHTTVKGFRRLNKNAKPILNLSSSEENTGALEECGTSSQINVTLKGPDVLKSPTSSILDTPITRTMKKELSVCRKLITRKNKMIDNLRKKNIRLKKKCSNLKNILSTLSKNCSCAYFISRNDADKVVAFMPATH